MAIFEDFGFDERFGETLTADEMEKLQQAHNTISVLQDKYRAWNKTSGGDADLTAYLKSKADAQRSEAADLERVKGNFR